MRTKSAQINENEKKLLLKEEKNMEQINKEGKSKTYEHKKANKKINGFNK